MDESLKQNAVIDLTTQLRKDFFRVREQLNHLESKIEKYNRLYNVLRTLSNLIPDHHKDKSFITETLLDYQVRDFLDLDKEQYETLDHIEMYVNSCYEKGKYEGREAVGILRRVIKAGNFDLKYLAEFDRRF